MTTGTMVDHSCGVVAESSWAVPKAPDHWYEWMDSSGFDIDPNVVQGKGLQQGAQFPRASRRVALVAKGNGKLEIEALSKGLGPLLNAWSGSCVSNNVSGGLYQQLATFASTSVSLPSLGVQEGIVNADGTVDAFTWRGCTVMSGELAVPENGIATLKLQLDARAGHATRTVADGVTTNTSAVVTSATAVWDNSDVGAAISGTGIPANTTILSVQSTTSITLSANATATGTGITFTIGLAYTPPTYASGGTLFHSGLPLSGALVLGGTLTAPTTTALGSMSGGTTAVGLKSWTASVDNGLQTDRDIIGGRNQAATGERSGKLKTVLEYDATTGRILQLAQARQTQMALLINAQTGELITAGNPATLQLALPVAAINSGAIPQPADGKVCTTEIEWEFLKGSAATALLAYRTADIAL